WHFGFYFSLCLFFMGFHYILVYIKNDCWYWRSDAAFRFANMDYDYRFRKDSRQKCCIIWSFIWSWICSGAYYERPYNATLLPRVFSETVVVNHVCEPKCSI